MTHYGLQSNPRDLACRPQGRICGIAGGQWTALKAHRSGLHLVRRDQSLAFRYQQLYNSLNMVDTREDFEQLIVETKGAFVRLQRTAEPGARVPSSPEQETEEITRSSLASDSATTIPISHLY